MLEQIKDYLNSKNVLNAQFNTAIQTVMGTINNQTVPERMKAVIAVSHIVNFTSQFRRNMVLWDGTEVPLNAISFVLTNSGTGKDSSNKAVAKAFSEAIKLIIKERKNLADEQAKKTAKMFGEEDYFKYEVYKEYLPPLPPLNMGITTEAGLVQHINDIAKSPIGSSFMYSGEIGDEFAYNQNTIDNIKVLSELYDLGIKEAKYTKGQDLRSEAINGQPVSALFVGSPTMIIYDENTKRKFQIAFMSKLARRSFFCYTPEKVEEPDFEDTDDLIKALIEHENNLKNAAIEARELVSSIAVDVANYQLNHIGETIGIDKEVYELFIVYKHYNELVVNELANSESTYALVRRHLQWKALKLAGSLAVMANSETVKEHHYIDAIRFCEALDKDMELFERDINKAYYEKFSDYIRSLILKNDEKISISVHEIKKRGFLNSVSSNKLKELIALCSSYDTKGIYTIGKENTCIEYKPIIQTEVLHVSYVPIDITELNTAIQVKDKKLIAQAKHNIAKFAVKNYKTVEASFKDLEELLIGTFAYSPFIFKDGVRSNENIKGGAKWVVLDVDKSAITAEEMHFMLNDFNHYIVLTSDPDNIHKYRVVLELDTEVKLDNRAWRKFIKHLSESIAINADILPQSQVYFSYGNRLIYTQLEAEPVITREFVIKALTEDTIEIEDLTDTAKNKLLQDRFNTFIYAFEAPYGTASRNVIKAVYHLKRLGGTYKQALDLFNDIQEYWSDPFELPRQERFKEQIYNIFHG